MIGLEDRRALALGIHIAHASGARLHRACEIAGIELRTLHVSGSPNVFFFGRSEGASSSPFVFF